MTWELDPDFYNKLKSKCISILRSKGLEQYAENALHEHLAEVVEKQNYQKKLEEMSSQERNRYLTSCIINKAKTMAKKANDSQKKNKCMHSFSYLNEDKIRSYPPWLYSQMTDGLNPEEILIFLLYKKYQQNEIAKILGVSNTTICRKVDTMRQKIRKNLSGGTKMSSYKYSDTEIYNFVDTQEPNSGFGNNNLRRAIRFLLQPIRSWWPSGSDDDTNPPIPTGLHEQIEGLIEAHQNPKSVEGVLDSINHGSYETHVESLHLLEAARQLNKPYRWISPEESLQIAENIEHAEIAKRYLSEIFRKSLVIYKSERNKNSDSIITLVIDKLKDLADRFEKQRGRGCIPFVLLPKAQFPLHSKAQEMDVEKTKNFKKYLNQFKESCDNLKEDDDTTFHELQSIVDFLIDLLDWHCFDAPRYLAPAIIEEAIELSLAVNRMYDCDKKDIFEELGDLLFMCLWMSNVLAIPNLDRKI